MRPRWQVRVLLTVTAALALALGTFPPASAASLVIEVARAPTGSTLHVDTFAASVRLRRGHAATKQAGSRAAVGPRSRVPGTARSM